MLEDPDGPIAQLDRVTDFYSVGCRFESCWDRHATDVKSPINNGCLRFRLGAPGAPSGQNAMGSKHPKRDAGGPRVPESSSFVFIWHLRQFLNLKTAPARASVTHVVN